MTACFVGFNVSETPNPRGTPFNMTACFTYFVGLVVVYVLLMYNRDLFVVLMKEHVL